MKELYYPRFIPDLRDGTPQPIKIEGVPIRNQGNRSWCGYMNIEGLLRYKGYDISAEQIYTHIHGEGTSDLRVVGNTYEYRAPKRPVIGTLAKAAEELTDLKARILTTKDYEQIEKRNGFKPTDVLKTYIRGEIPCMVRTRSHFVTVVGFDDYRKEYLINDSLVGRQVSKHYDHFEKAWEYQEEEYPDYNPQNLMLVLFNRKTKKQ